VSSLVLMGFGVTISAVMVASSVKVLKLSPKGQEGVFSALNFLMVPVGGSVGVAIFSYVYALKFLKTRKPLSGAENPKPCPVRKGPRRPRVRAPRRKRPSIS
jgi:predicted MFS family arabinose efflux permease